MLQPIASTGWRFTATMLLVAVGACGGGASGQNGPAGNAVSQSGAGSGSGSASAGGSNGTTGSVAASGDPSTDSGTGATSGVHSGSATGAVSGASTGTAGSGVSAGSGAVSAGGDAGATEAGQPVLQNFVCTELIGLWVASQWWPPFYAAVDKPHWQFMFQHHGYLELFSDPASPFWNNATMSPCAMASKTPDRVVFLPFSLTLKTLADWQMQLTKVVQTIQGKFPSAKRIELITTIRGPGNMMCAGNTDPDTIVAPYVDQAIQNIADQSGGLVTVGPKIEVANCGWWAGNSHDLTGAGNTGVAQRYAAYYNAHP